jgi:hypothetical protein
MSYLSRLAAASVAFWLLLVPLGAGAATVTLDLSALGSLTLPVGQSKSFTLGASQTTVGKIGSPTSITTWTTGLTITLVGMTTKGGDGIQSQNVTTPTGTQQQIENFNLATIPGKGGVTQNVFQSALNFSSSGAGVTNTLEGTDGKTGLPKDATSIDGSGGYVDFIEVILSQSAALSGASFTDFNLNKGVPKSQFEWASDTSKNGVIGNGDVISGKVNIAGLNASVFANATSSAFLLSATGGSDSFALRSLSLTYTPLIITLPPGIVPLPAPGLLLIGALGGLGLISGRRRRAMRRD